LPGNFQKLKSEYYSNLGGVNTKASRYITGRQQALDLRNYSLSSRVGSLTSRCGSTFLIGSTFVGEIGGVYNFEQTTGVSQIIFGADTNLFRIQSGTGFGIRSGLLNNGIFDFVTFVDRLFAANGQDFFKYDGNQSYNFSLPPGPSLGIAATGSGGLTGFVQYAFGYENESGYAGPAINICGFSLSTEASVNLTGFTSPASFGISTIILYQSLEGGDFLEIAELPFATTAYSVTNIADTQDIIAPEWLYFTNAPQFLELYNNQMFLGGFSAFPSTFYWSEIAQPEAIGATNFAEIRTDDGDHLSAFKNSDSELLIWKTRSFHVLRGTDPRDFEIVEKSLEYGCLSNRAVVTFENSRVHFLDIKGVCEYDKANVFIKSQPISPVFERMNPEAAYLSQMLYVKARNEVWTAIPVDGATYNNLIVVYDTLTDGWTFYDNLRIKSMGIIKNAENQELVAYGDFSGALHYFHDDLYRDSFSAFTTLVTWPFVSGKSGSFSTEKVFRRLWLDIDPTFGATHIFNVKMYADQGSSLALDRTMTISNFQERMEFGISCKSLSLQAICGQDIPNRINGYTFADRFLRDL
jgi:hypothetical protein